MKKLNKLKIWAAVATLFWLGGTSCTKLDVKTYSVIPSSTFWQNPTEIAEGKAPAYAQLAQVVGHNGYGNEVEISSDEQVYPTRGSDWYDGGQWGRIYFHTYLPSDVDGNLNGVWSSLFSGAGNCNFVIYTLNNLSTPDPTLQADLAEMVALRSYYYYLAMDLWGNIPYVTNFKVDPSTVTNLPRAQVFDSIETNLKAVIPYLPTNVDVTTYGKVTKYFAYSLLARMYLNAKVYTGKDRSADCKAMCDAIISSGSYALDASYYNPFYGANNTNTRENIFVVPESSNGLIAGNGQIQANIEFNSALTFGIPCCGFGNNGSSTTHDFYSLYDTASTYTWDVATINGRKVTRMLRTFNDQRSGQWLIGQQFQGDGITNYPPDKNWVVATSDYCCTYNGDTSVANTTKIGDFYNGIYTPVVIYDTMNQFSNPAGYFRHAGVRNVKYWPQPGPSNGAMSNAYVVFRLADIYLMRAEAEYNLGMTGPALDDVNIVRTRAYNGSTAYNWKPADLTAANILAERGRELAYENVRRTDLVRFGLYTKAQNYPPKPADPDDHTILLPIPVNQLNTNKNLKQNPGY